MCIFVQNLDSPVGNIVVKSNGSAITDIFLGEYASENPDYLTAKAVKELKHYFDGTLTEFTFPIEPDGTEFQKRVWEILTEIPYGKTFSYGDVAERLGGLRYSRAVGGAVNKNPILIAIPCHRVIGADGSLTGFACGLTVKKYLLDLEKKMLLRNRIMPFELNSKYNTQKKTKAANYKFLNETVALHGQTVLAGDSITEIFNDYELFYEWAKENDCAVYNRGISGDTSNRLSERFYDNVLNISPRNIVLLIGTNDIGMGRKNEDIAKEIKGILAQIRSKSAETNVILEAVYPVNKNLSTESRQMVGRRTNDKICELNALLKPLANDFGCVWLDLTDALSDEDGNLHKDYCYDGLHLNANGFKTVAEHIVPLLK